MTSDLPTSDVLAETLLQDDTKFFLIADRASLSAVCKLSADDADATPTSVDAATHAAALATAGDGSETFSTSDNLQETAKDDPEGISADQASQLSTNSGEHHHCVLGTSFIIESTSSLAAAAAAAIPDPSMLKSEPIDTSCLEAWAAAAAASTSQQQQHILQQHQHILQQHQIIHHQQLAAMVSNDVQQAEPTKVLMLPSLTPNALQLVAAASANYGHGHGHGHEHNRSHSQIHGIGHSFGHIPELPKRCRTNLTEEQKSELENTFAKSKYPDYPIVDELSRGIGLPYKKVLVWFKNRRAKEKRTRKADFDLCAGGSGGCGSNGGSGISQGRVAATVGSNDAAFSVYNAGSASTTAASAAAAAAAAALNAAQRYPFATTTPYSSIRHCLPLVAPSPYQQHPAHQRSIGAANAYWIPAEQREAAPPSAVPTAAVIKCEPGFFHHSQQQQQQQPQQPPFSFPVQQLHQPLPHHYVFVAGENIATQTSPSMLEFEDAVADAGPLSTINNISGSSGGSQDIIEHEGNGTCSDEFLVKVAASTPHDQSELLGLSNEQHRHQQMEHQASFHLPPFSLSCRPSSVASTTEGVGVVAFDAAASAFLNDPDVRIP